MQFMYHMIILLTRYLARIIVNTCVTPLPWNHMFSNIFDEFCLKLWHTTQKLLLCANESVSVRITYRVDHTIDHIPRANNCEHRCDHHPPNSQLSARALWSIIWSFLVQDFLHPRGPIIVIFELCVTILSKIHQKYLENHDFRGVVVAPVFTVIRTSSVVNNMINLDSGFSPDTLEAP